MQITVIEPTVDVVTEQQLVYNATPAGSQVVFSQDKLGAGETIQIFQKAGTTLREVTALNSDGTATIITLSELVPQVTLPNGLDYYATKSATALACGLYCDHLRY